MSPWQVHLFSTSTSSSSSRHHTTCYGGKGYLKSFYPSVKFCIIYVVYPYHSKVHNDICSDDYETDDKRNDSQMESFPTQPLGAIIVLFIIAVLGLRGEWKVKFKLKIFNHNGGSSADDVHACKLLWSPTFLVNNTASPIVASCTWHRHVSFLEIYSKHLERNYSPPCFGSTFISLNLPFLLSPIQIWNKFISNEKQRTALPKCLILLLTATKMQQLLLAHRHKTTLSLQGAQRPEANLNVLLLSNASTSLNFGSSWQDINVNQRATGRAISTSWASSALNTDKMNASSYGHGWAHR